MTLYTSKTLLGLLWKGGGLMIPLLILSLITIYIIVERWLIYHSYLHYGDKFLAELEAQIYEGDIEGVSQLCLPQKNIIQQAIYKGLCHRQATKCALILESESNKMVAYLEKNLSLLATVATVAPMVGFLGTVVGMIQTFMAMAQEQDLLSSQFFAGGIYQAMVTTVVGLIVGIVAYLGYYYYLARANHAAQQLAYFINLFLAKF